MRVSSPTTCDTACASTCNKTPARRVCLAPCSYSDGLCHRSEPLAVQTTVRVQCVPGAVKTATCCMARAVRTVSGMKVDDMTE